MTIIYKEIQMINIVIKTINVIIDKYIQLIILILIPRNK